MTFEKPKIEWRSFVSFAELLKALVELQFILRVKIYSFANKEPRPLDEFAKSVAQAEKMLRSYLFQLSRTPRNKICKPKDVITAFKTMSETWKNIPATERSALKIMHPISVFENSITHLMQDSAALQAANKEVHISLIEIIEDEIS